MFVGFGLFFLIIFTLVLAILWGVTKKKTFWDLIRLIWISVFALFCLGFILNILTSKMRVTKEDIYGEYVIDRDMFAGKQADWQYNHYRFKITEENKLYLFITNKERVVKTIVRNIDINSLYINAHLDISPDESVHHILKDNPTLYRDTWSFYYVFESGKYGNMFFKKGSWEPID
jgi:hypothetical protein